MPKDFDFNLPLSDAVDILLADVALKIQLSRTDHDLAIEHYKAIADWLERDGSPLRGRVARLYAQGSMAINATISSKLDNDEFDIDIIAELALAPDSQPCWVLDTLFAAINGEEGSRYYGRVTRHTRCIAVQYDRMHLDLTPKILLPDRLERTGLIFHAKREEPRWKDRRVIANPWGFAQWFQAQTPVELAFAEALTKRAEAEPVPAQHPVYAKSKALIVLQLLKRWRNKRYDRRDGRQPPSIMMAKIVGDAVGPRASLLDELWHQAQYMFGLFDLADRAGELVHFENPMCREDILTDRWPGDLATQKVFRDDLEYLVRKVEALRSPISLEQKQAIMADLFGERPTRYAFEKFREALGDLSRDGGLRHFPRSGAIALGASGLSAPAIVARPAPVRAQASPKHTFFGGRKPTRECP